MSPEAHGAYVAPTARVPRELFGHAHESGNNVFPTVLDFQDTGRIILKIPDNWNGIDDAYFIAVPEWTDANFTCIITINAGQDTEAVNIHTQTVNPFDFASTANVFNYVDLAIPFAVVLAALTAGDTVTIDIAPQEDGYLLTLYGAVISES